jgi:hypothetical protein
MGSSSSHKIAIVLPQQSRPSLFGPGRPRLASVGATSQAAIGAFLGTDAEVKGRLWAVPAVRPALPAAGRALPSRTPITYHSRPSGIYRPLGRYWLQSGRVSVGLARHFEQRSRS